jgi:hypothetical protein
MMPIHRAALLPALLVVTHVACSMDGGTLVMGDVEFAAPAGSGEPNLFVTEDGRVMLTWFEPTEEGHALRVSLRSAEGWSAPMTIAENREFFVNWADFPSIAALDDGTWVVHWLEKVASSSYAYHALLSLSRDEGRTWSDPVPAHRDRSPTEHGFVTTVPVPDGRATLVWLDGRNTGGEGEHRGAMTLRSTTLSADGTFGEEILLDERICDCCQTAMVRTASGLVAAYRDRSEEEIRDIAVVRYADGEWSEPAHVGNDNWHIPACPVNGPSLAAVGDNVGIAWFTAPEGESKVLASFSTDGGTSFGEPVRVDDGRPLGRVGVQLLDDASALVMWLERVGEEAEIRAKRVTRSGEASQSWLIADTNPARRSGFPRMARVGADIIFAWTLVGEDGGVRVASARVR